MAHDLIDELDRHLLAARPNAADASQYACDEGLLRRLWARPVEPRRRRVPVKVATPVAAVAVATGVLLLGGGAGQVGAPSAAAAVTQTLHWLTPAPGTILHARSVESRDGHETIRDFWQSGDDPARQRERLQGEHSFESSGEELYDPANDTIYVPPGKGRTGPPAAVVARIGAADPIVTKVRMLLADGRMTVGALEKHNGVESWPLSLKEGLGRDNWTLWVSAADGKPLELRDGEQIIRWTSYEVSRGDENAPVLSLHGAHPQAAIVTDPAAVTEAQQRLEGMKVTDERSAKK